MKFNIGTRNEIITAMKSVVNKNDINEIADYIINNREKKQIKSFNNHHNVEQFTRTLK